MWMHQSSPSTVNTIPNQTQTHAPAVHAAGKQASRLSRTQCGFDCAYSLSAALPPKFKLKDLNGWMLVQRVELGGGNPLDGIMLAKDLHEHALDAVRPELIHNQHCMAGREMSQLSSKS
jgi:hypothetical protein